MQLSDMRLLFDAGSLTRCTIKHAALQGGYILYVSNYRNEIRVMASQREPNEPRSFKTIDAAISAARQIGFREVKVEIDW